MEGIKMINKIKYIIYKNINKLKKLGLREITVKCGNKKLFSFGME